MNRTHKPYLGVEKYFKDKKITLTEVALSLGISLASLYNKLRGRSDFTLSEVVTLFDKYGISIDLFCE